MVQNASISFTGATSSDFLTASNWSTGTLPTDYHDVNIAGTESAPVAATLSSAYTTDVPSLTIGDYGSLVITACDGSDASATPVFTADAVQIFATGSLTIDTSSPVDLGINEVYGTLTINDTSNTVMTAQSLNGTGTVVLNNSTLGSEDAGVSIGPDLNVTLSGGSTLYTGGTATGASITFDPNTLNMVVLSGQQPINTVFNNVSANSEFALNGADGVVPVSAQYSANGDGSYSLNITTSGNQTITLGNIHTVDGYTPGSVTITKDLAGDYVIADSSLPASSTTGWPPGHDHTSSCDNNGGGGHCQPHQHDGGGDCGTGWWNHAGWQDGSSACSGSGSGHQSGGNGNSGSGCDSSFWQHYAQDHFSDCAGSWTKPSTSGSCGTGSFWQGGWESHGCGGSTAAAAGHSYSEGCGGGWSHVIPQTAHCG